jgi:hypothetical protein
MIPFSIACGRFGRPFAPKGETDPEKFVAVSLWLDVGSDRGVVWLMQGAGPLFRTSRCTAKGWVEHLEEIGADLVPDEALNDAWKAIRPMLKHHYATVGVGHARPWPDEPE